MTTFVTRAAAVLRWCSCCAATREFVALECVDGHGEDCPEHACIVCGVALLLPVKMEPDVVEERRVA
jgi:hypothetical protein